MRDPTGRQGAVSRWKAARGAGKECEDSGLPPRSVLWLLVPGVDLLIRASDAGEAAKVDQVGEGQVYSPFNPTINCYFRTLLYILCHNL